MKKSRTPALPSENLYFIYGLFVILEILVFIFSSYKVTGDDDFFWHLATGRYVVENKVVPDKDVFGYVTAGNDWIPFEWGWDVIIFGLYSLVTLFGQALHPDGTIPVAQSAWYHKPRATFRDVFTVVRQHLWGNFSFPTSATDPDVVLLPRSTLSRLAYAACY